MVSYFFQTCWSGSTLAYRDLAFESSLMLSSVDKGTLAASSVMGIQTDNHLKGQQYALLGTILYVGIIIGEVRASAPPPSQTLTSSSATCESTDPAGSSGKVPGDHHLLGGVSLRVCCVKGY